MMAIALAVPWHSSPARRADCRSACSIKAVRAGIVGWASIFLTAIDRSASRPGPGDGAGAAVVADTAEPGCGRSDRFHDVVLPHLDAAYNLARFLTREADAADDIVQDAFLRAFRGFDGYRGGDARAWLLAIVRNCVRQWAGERTRARALSEPLTGTDASNDETIEIADPEQDTPEARVLRDSEASLIRRLIETLPEVFREVLVMREFDDLSYREIAEITEVPIGTVMSRLARARQMFASAWRDQGIEEALR